jgi:hypothetical protein
VIAAQSADVKEDTCAGGRARNIENKNIRNCGSYINIYT